MSAVDKSDNTAKNALSKGGADYIFKPIIPSILLRRIQDILTKGHNLKREKQFVKLIKNQQKSIQNLESLLNTKTEHIDTPIEEITRTLTSAISNEEVPSKLRGELGIALKLLALGNLFTPSLENQNIDELEKSIVTDYLQGGTKRRGSLV